MATDRNYGAELDALAEGPFAPESVPAFPGEGAAAVETAGGAFPLARTSIDRAVLEKEASDFESVKSARDESSKGLLGDWGKLDEVGQRQWVAGEKAQAESEASFWDSVVQRVEPGITSFKEYVGRQITGLAKTAVDPDAGTVGKVTGAITAFGNLPSALVGDWFVDKATRNALEARHRRALAEDMERGALAPPQYATWRARVDDVARGVGSTLASMTKGMAYTGYGLAYQNMSDAQKSSVHAIGAYIEDKAKEAFPADPARAREFSTALGEGAGSMVAFFGPALAARMLGAVGNLGAVAMSAGAGSSAQSGQMVDEALAVYSKAAQAEGRTSLTPEEERQATQVWLMGLGIGATEAAPFAAFLGGQSGRMARRVLMQMVEEGGQEYAQTILENAVAKHFYDPDRRWDDNAWTGLAVGSILGAKMQVAGEAAGALKRRREEPARNDRSEKEGSFRPDSDQSETVRDVSPSLDPNVQPGKAPSVRMAPDPVIDEARAVIDEVAPPAAPVAPAAPVTIPSFADIMGVLPKDEAGDPDVGALMQSVTELGAKAWGGLTAEQKAAVYQRFAPVVEQAAPVVERVAEAVRTGEAAEVVKQVAEAVRGVQLTPERRAEIDAIADKAVRERGATVAQTQAFSNEADYATTPERKAEMAYYREALDRYDPETNQPKVSASRPALRDRIRLAYLEATNGKVNARALLKDVRASLPDVDRATLDNELLQMQRDEEGILYRLDNGRDITGADQEAAISIAGEPRHILWIERMPAKKTGSFKAEPQEAIAPPVSTARSAPARSPAQIRAAFDKVLASKTKRADWAAETGVDQAQIDTLINEALKDGRLKKTKAGAIVRTAKAKAAEAKPGAATAAAMTGQTTGRPTVDRQTEVRANASKNDIARRYALAIAEAPSSTEISRIIEQIKADKKASHPTLNEIIRILTGRYGKGRNKSSAYAEIEAAATKKIAKRGTRAAPVQDEAVAAPPASPIAAAPAPAAAAEDAPRDAAIGIVTPDGSMTVRATPQLVELSSLKAASGALQPRDRSRAEAMAAVREIATRLDPEQLMPARVSDTGAPIVSADGTIISGNGRVMALQEVYYSPELAERAQTYRKALGPDAASMRAPVLVMRLSAAMSREDLERFADMSNRSRIASMSATERAIRDARAVGPEVMGFYNGGSFTSPANQDFLRLFTARLPAVERGAFSRNGVLTKEGEDRMSAAVLAAAYGDPDTLSRMLESTDDNIKSVTGAMRDAAGAFIRLKAAIASGEASAAFDITPQVAEVAKRIADLRDRKITPRTFLDQIDAFNQVDPIVESLLVAFYNDNLSRQLGREKLTEILVRYAEEAAKHKGDGLFEDTTSPRDVISVARTRALEGERLAASQGNLFDSGPRAAGGDTAGGRGAGQGSAPDGRRADAGGQSLAAGGLTDAPSGGANLERDWRNGPPQDSMGEAGVPTARAADAGRSGQGGQAPTADGQPAGGGRLSDGDAAALGERGDREVQGDAPGTGAGLAGGRGRERGGDAGVEGLPPERLGAEALDKSAANAARVAADTQRQRAADENVAFVANDIENIRATLPLLNAANQADVAKAEARFTQPAGFGFLFTNGTGTGKTFLGLGVIKRFERQEKRNILILAPSQGILDGWIRSGEMMNLGITRLDDTQTAGEGVVATTYANLRDNNELVKRSWDLIIADEAHSLSQNQSGAPSEALQAFRGLTNHSPASRARMLLAPMKAAIDRAKEGNKAFDTDQFGDVKAMEEDYFRQLTEATDRFKAEGRSTRALFLSATPFAYRKSTEWAEGFLYDYPADSNRYGVPGGRDAFLVQNFGYNFRYNRAEEPGPEVNTSVLEREFYERLKREGVLSGRRLDVEADYDRRFVLVDDAVGQKIDQAMDWLTTEGGGRYRPLYEKFQEKFNYLSQRRLLEAIKARHVIPRIRKDLALGRKVVVFHDYNEGGGINPFEAPENPNERSRGVYGQEAPTLGELYYEFIRANPYVKTLNFKPFTSPIETLTKAFGDRAAVYNGRIPNKKRAKARDEFNRDGSGLDVIIVQSAAGEAGISLHDTTGKHQRILYNLGLPTRPTTAIQQEGRIYREGQVSDAILRYMSTGTGWERRAFAQTIAERASTAENLALGDEARALRDGFIDAFNEADEIEQGPDEGKGGKTKDRSRGSQVTPFERAKAFYFGQLKTKGRRDQREGADYYATPEPVGLKMVEFADVRTGEKVLEPSAGHGAIARWFPEGANRVLIEPSSTLASRAGLSSPGASVIQGRFEDHYIGNKYDAIVMNPPFGHGGKDAFDHLQKAVGHLRFGGRIVAIVPRGGLADRRYESFRDADENKNVYVAADIALPGVMFERAGTKVATRMVVIEKHQTPDTAPTPLYRDLSDAETITELFNRIEGLSLSARVRDGERASASAPAIVPTSVTAPAPAVATPVAAAPAAVVPPTAAPEPVAPPAQTPRAPTLKVRFKLGETKHGKTGADLFVASIAEFVPRDTYEKLRDMAKRHGGYYSTFRGSGAIPGFQFASEKARASFLQEVEGPKEAAKPKLEPTTAPPSVEEDRAKLEDIVNPIDRNASPEEKLRQIAALTAVNKPLLDAQLKAMDAAIGTTSNANIKKPDTILSKASRPSILAEKPWHGVEHIRDTLRFQTKISRFEQIEQAAQAMLSQGYSIVKIDTKKMLAPKEWGWRFAGFDLRAPNGQLIEWYIIFDTMYAAKKKGHLLFEKWRNETDETKEARRPEYAADIEESYRLYQDAFESGLRNSGYAGLADASADIAKLSASLPVTAAKFSAMSTALGSGVAPPFTGSQAASGPGLNQLEGPLSTIARPDLSSNRTTGDFAISPSSRNPDYIGRSAGQNNLGATEGRVTPALSDSDGQILAALRAFLDGRRSTDEAAKVIDRAALMKAFKAPFSLRGLLDRQMRTVGFVEAEPFDLDQVKGRRVGVRDVPLDRVFTIQGTVSVAGVKAKLSQPTTDTGDLPSVFKWGDDYFVNDGNHRIMAARARASGTVKAEVIDLSDKDMVAALAAAVRSSDTVDKVTRAYQFIARQVRAGKRVPISEDVTNALLDAAWPHSGLVPPGAQVAALAAVRPPDDAEKRLAPWADSVGEFRSLDGGIITTPLRLAAIPDYRAGFDRRSGAILFFGLNRASLDGLSEAVMRSRIAHESVHAVWKSLPRGVKSRLVRHARALGVLDMQLGTVLRAIGEATVGTAQEQETLADLYAKQYANAPDLEDRMAQESVAHLRELAAAGFFMDGELSPIAGDMALLDGVQEGMATPERPAALSAALQASAARATLADHFGATRIEDIGPADPHPGRVLAFHGMPTPMEGGRLERRNEVQSFGVHFGSSAQASRFANRDGGNIMPSALDLDSVVTVVDRGQYWRVPQMVADVKAQRPDLAPALAGVEAAIADYSKAPGRNAAEIEARNLALTHQLQDALTKAGVKGLRYWNRFEAPGWSYIVWEPGHVISATSGEMLFAIASAQQSMRAAAERGVELPGGVVVNGVPIQAASDEILAAIRAFHGSPHDFDRFDASRIGTGEGAQAFGFGLYFAENEAVARDYRNKLSGKPAPVSQADAKAYKFAVLAKLRGRSAVIPDIELKQPGRMYEVSIKANPEDFLDWDKPLSQQSENVRRIAEAKFARLGDEIGPKDTGRDLLSLIEAEYGRDVLSIDRKAAAEFLRSQGVSGIRYLDQGSRGAGEGSYNYVVFDDADVEIVAKDGVPVTPEILAAIGGGLAATANQEALSRAMEMDATAPDREADPDAYEAHRTRIWDETGWYKGVDGQWRFEIPDRPFIVREGVGYDRILHANIAEAYVDAGLDEIAAGVAADDTGARGRTILNDTNKDGEDIGPHVIVIGPRDTWKVTALHELQHLIQEQEGFAVGGNAKSATMYVEGVPQLQEAVDAARAHLKASKRRMFRRIPLTPQWRAVRKAREDVYAADKALNEALDRVGATSSEQRYALYQRLAGEVEARMVEKRLGMTAKERRARPPWLDYDVPESDQIVVLRLAGDRESASQSPPLDMSPEARKQRAEEMGFDTRMVWYRGARDFDHDGPVWVTDSADYAENFPLHSNGNTAIAPLYVRRAKFKDSIVDLTKYPADHGFTVDEFKSAVGIRHRRLDDDLETLISYDMPTFEAFQAFDLPSVRAEFDNKIGIKVNQYVYGGGEGVGFLILDPSNIRSVNAAFDPAETASTSLMAALGGGVPRDAGAAPGARQPTPAGVGIESDTEADAEASPALNAVIQKLKDALGVIPTQTLMGVTIRAEDGSGVRLNPQRNVRGQTQSATGAVGVRKSRAIDVIAHEMGHALEVTLGAEILDLQRKHEATLQAFAPDRTLSESWADWFSHYVMSGPHARAVTGDLVADFEDVIEANAPDMLEGLHEAQEMYQDWLKRATPEALASDVVSTYAGNSWTELAAGDRSLSETVSGKLAGAYTAVIDELAPVQQMVRRLLGVADRNGVTDEAGRPISLSVAENPYKIARMFRGAHATGYSWLKNGIANRGETTISFPGLAKALETLFGTADQSAWDPAMYQAAGNYLIAKRAVAEYDRLEQKGNRLAEIEGVMARGDLARQRTAADRDRARAALERREAALLRAETLMRDRSAALKAAEAEVRRLQERIQDKKDDVLAAQMAREASLVSRRQRDLANLERQSAAALGAVTALRDEYEALSTDVAILNAEIPQRREQVTLAERRIATIETAVGTLARERDLTAKRGASRPPTRETRDHWLDVIAKTEADPKYARIKEFAAGVYGFSQGLLALRKQAGLISDDLYVELSKRKDWYVPFQRDMSDASAETVFGGGMKKWSPFKKFDGSDRAIINPLETLASDAYATAQQIAFNDAAGALASLAERAGPGAAAVAHVLTREEAAEANAATFDRIRDIALSMGIDAADADRIVHQIETNFAGEQLSLTWSPATSGPVSLPQIPVWRNGERTMIRLTDPEFGTEVFNAMSGMGKETASWLAEFFATPARVLQMGITTHPTFMPRNLFRDIFDAWIKTGALPILTQVKGAQTMRDPEFMRRYYEAGGVVGGRNVAALTSQEQQRQVLDLGENRISRGSIVLGAIGGGLLGTLYGGPIGGVAGALAGGYALRRGEVLKAVEAAETMTRVGVAAYAYKRALEHNPDLSESEAMLEAAFVARDVFDWNRRGSKMVFVVRAVTFLNAQIQGLDAAVRRLGGESDRGAMLSKHLGMVWRRETGGVLSADEERALGDAYKTWARMGVYTMGLLALYALATSGDDEDDKKYQDIRDKTKATHSWLPNVFGVDFRLPKAFEWAMPANIIEAIADKIRGRDPRAWDRVVDSTYEVMAPPLVPQAANLIVGLATNAQLENLAPWVKRFLGRDPENVSNRQIVGDQLARLDPESQFDAFTTQLSIDVAKAMTAAGVPRDLVPSPKKIDFILRSGGYWGQDIAKGYGIVREGLGYRPREAPRVSDIPVVAGFTGVAARQSKSRDELMQLMAQSGGQLATAAATYKQLIDEEGSPADAERLLSRLNPEERAYTLLKYYGSPQQVKDHPLERLLAVDRTLSKIRKDMILDRLTPVRKEGRRTVRDFDEKIALSPRKQTEIHEIVERLQQAEAWNTMVLMKRPGWEGKTEIAVKPILDELKASSAKVHELYEDRLQATRAREFSDVKADWPELRARILRDGKDAF